MTVLESFDLSSSFLARYVPDWTPDDFIAGAELEIEDLQQIDYAELDNHSISTTEDGSLRNNGRELLLPPSRKEDLVEEFMAAHMLCKYGDAAFTERTSVHVHVNVMGMEVDQLTTLLKLYAIFEPLAFSFAKPIRRNNIHCVPLGSTHMPNFYGKTLGFMVEHWSKYTAFNMLPVSELGTVEFRHLEGMGDADRFRAWLDFIECLYKNALRIAPFKKAYLQDLTVLRDIHRELLTPEFYKQQQSYIRFRLEDSLLDVKLSYI